MSTITYRDGIMAADSRAYNGGRTPIGAKMKIHRLEDGSLLGVSSPVVGQGEALRDWFNAGADVSEHPSPLDFQALLVKANGEVFYYSDTPFPSGPLAGPFWAIGSGEQYALGAMVCGATAIQAVEVAAGLDSMSQLPVAALTLRPEIEPEQPAPEDAAPAMAE